MAEQNVTASARTLLGAYLGAIVAAISLLALENDAAHVDQALEQIRNLRLPIVTAERVQADMAETIQRERDEASDALNNCAGVLEANGQFPDVEGIEDVDYSATPMRRVLADLGYQRPGAPDETKKILLRTPDTERLQEKVCKALPAHLALDCDPAGCLARVQQKAGGKTTTVEVPWRTEELAYRIDLLGRYAPNATDAFHYEALLEHYAEIEALTPVEAEKRLMQKQGEASFEVPLIKLQVPLRAALFGTLGILLLLAIGQVFTLRHLRRTAGEATDAPAADKTAFAHFPLDAAFPVWIAKALASVLYIAGGVMMALLTVRLNERWATEKGEVMGIDLEIATAILGIIGSYAAAVGLTAGLLFLLIAPQPVSRLWRRRPAAKAPD